MDGVSAKLYRGLRGYWRRRGYEKLSGAGRRQASRSELGSTGRRRFWRIKIRPKLKILRISSPKKFFIWLRDAYVNMMMGFANSPICTSRGMVSDGVLKFGKGPLKEYDEKAIVEIYKSLMVAQGQLLPRDAAKLSSQSRIVCRSQLTR